MTDITGKLRYMLVRSRRVRAEVDSILAVENSLLQTNQAIQALLERLTDNHQRAITVRLAELSDQLALRYVQACQDLDESSRLSWTSIAHELRDILASVLRILAPDELVMKQAWYVPIPDTKGPTHMQRAKFILSQNRQSGPELVNNDQAQLVDELVAKITRSTYTVGSALAHTKADKKECVLLMMQFNTLMFSLLDTFSASEQLVEGL